MNNPLSVKELELMNAYWRACNYLSVGMIYLQDNPLLSEPLQTEHVKKRLLGHWGSSPALSFTWLHLNRMIVKYDLDMIFVAGPGHGAPGVLGPSYLEGTYSEVYPEKTEDAKGMKAFFRQFSVPGQIGSHVTPETPGSIHEGGELGYSLSPTPTACRSTARISSWPAWSVMARRRPGRSRRPGTRTSSSTRCATAPCCRS